MLSIEQLHSHTCAELVGMCKELGLPHSGRRKQLLVQALFDYQRSNGGIPLPVLARNSFRSHNAAAARYQQQQALLHHQQQQSGQMLPHTPPRSSQANGAVAAPMSFPLQKQLSGHPVGCVVAGQSAAGGLCGPLGPGFPPPPTGAAAVAGGVTGSHAAPAHAAPATASTGGTTTSNNSGGGAGQGVFSRCICKGAAGGSSSRGRVHAKSLKCKICGSLSHLSCYPDVTGPAAQKFVCSTCRMKRLDPFYPVEEVLWETRLEGSHYSVDITSYVLRKWRAEGKEVIVRCMQLDQPLLYQTWPKSIQISINGRTEETVAAPSWEHKRRDMPIVITQYLKNGKNRVEFWWTNYEEPKSFHLAILLCTYSSPEALAKALELRSHVGEAEARRRVLSIVTNKNGRRGSTQQEDDDDVTCMEVTRRIKLLCPITFTRIAVPCRGGSCMHLQCFDLWGFLLVTRNTKAFNTRWKCPECQLYVRPDELVIDDFVLQILKSTSEDATVIELEADGSYRVVSEQELKEESKRAEAQRLRAAGACRVKRAIDEDASCASPSAAAALPEDGPTKKAFEIVEMLSSSEDEEEALAIESSSSAAPPAQAPPDLSASPTAPTGACALEAAAGTAAPGAALAVAAVSAAAPVAASTTATRRAAEDTQAGAESASSAASSAIATAGGALPPALVSSLRSAAAAASAAAPGGMLFSPAATVAGHQQQQRHEPVAVPQERRLSFSPEEETEEGEDDEDSAIRVGRFYKRLRRTALSPASSPASPGTVENPASVPPRQQQRQLVPGGSVSEGLSAAVGAAAATGGSLQRRMSARAAARAASASAAAGGAAESAQSVFTKAHALTAAAFPSTSSEQLHEQPPSSSEGGDVVVVISSDEEEELVAAAWTPVLTPQQQRRQQRRQQEQVRRRLQDEERQEQRKLVAQAAAAARQHARRTETLPEETPADVGAEAKDQQNISLPQIATLTLLSPPAATEAGAQALLSNLHLPFPATPQRGAAIEHSVSKDTNSETHVGTKAAELLQLLLERQRQELEQREKLPAQEVEQQQQLSLHRLTSVSSEEEASHQPAPSCWQAPERHADSSSGPADAPTSTTNNSNRNVPWTLGEATITGRGRQSSIERTGEVATARPPAQSAAAADSPAAAGLGGSAVPTPGSAPVHGDAAAESSGFEQESSRVHDSTPVADAANLFFAPTSLSSASFPGVIPPCSFPCAASQLARPACGAAAGVAAAAPFARRDGSNDSGNTRGRNFGVPDACVVPTSSYYYLDPSSINVSNSSVLQQKQISSQVQQQPFQQQRQQEHVQQLRPCGGTDEGALPTYGTVHNTRNGSADPSSVLEMYSHALQHQQPQQILEQLQQQVQQAMQESVQLQQHVKEQQRVQQQRVEQQRVEQHAMQQLQSLQQPRVRVPLSRETVEQAETAEEQLAYRDSAATDSMEREETRSDATKKVRTVVGAHSSSNRSRRFSTRERSSRSNSMERADADAGHRMKEGEDLISESCRQPFTSAQRAPLHAVFHKADAAPAPARDKVEGSFSASTRVSAEVRGQPMHEHSQNQQQQHPLEYEQLQRTQQQQQLRRGTAGVTPGRSVVPETHPAPGKPFAPPAAAAEAAGPASAAPASQLVWPVAASATAPVRTTYDQAASAGTDRKPSAAGEVTLPAEAAAAGPAATKGMAANLSAAGGIQGATGARKGPRMSLPPRSCIAGLRPDSGGPSKSTASSENDKNASCAAVSSVASSSGSLVVTSTAAMPRAGVALPAASTGSHGKQQPGLSRSATSVAAPAAFIPSVGNTGGSGASLQPKSPARRLLVPPVPPPLKSLRQAGNAGGSAQEDRGSSTTSTHRGQSSSVSGPPSGGSSSGSQLGQEERIPSRLPAAGAATTLTESSTVGATAASVTSTTVSPAPAPPRPHGTPAAAAGRPNVAALPETTGREATLRDMGHSGEFLASWSRHTSINSDDRRSTRAVSDVGDCGPGLERRRSGSSEGQRGSSNNSSRGRVCSPDSMHYSREADYASSDMSLPPAAAECEDFPAPASYSTQRGHGEFRTRSSGSNKEGDGQAETSGKYQGSKDLNTADYGTEDSSGLQSRSGASTRARCSSSVRAAVASHCRNPRQESEAAVSCCSTLEDLHRGEEEDLYGRPLGVERQVFAARHDEMRKACAKGSSSTAANDTAGAFRKGSESYSSDKESTAPQTAGIPDSADTAGLQRTEFREAGAAAADHPPLLPRQAAGGRRRVSVVLALHPATHAVRPPAGFFSTEDSVAASPSADSGTRRSARETDGDELHAGAVLDSSTNDSDVSQLHHDQQKDGTADSSCPCVTKPYTSSLPVREDARESGVGASDAAVTSVRNAVGSSFSESNNALAGGAAPPIDATRTDFNWADGLLSDGCGEAGAVSSSSLYSAAERTARTSRAQQKPQLVSQGAAKELQRQFVPTNSEVQGQEHDSETRAAGPENNKLRRDGDTDAVHSSTLLSPTPPQLQTRAAVVWEQQCEPTSAASGVREVGSTTGLPDTAPGNRTAGALCTDEEHDRGVKVDSCSKGIASCADSLESSEEGAAGPLGQQSEKVREHFLKS